VLSFASNCWNSPANGQGQITLAEHGARLPSPERGGSSPRPGGGAIELDYEKLISKRLDICCETAQDGPQPDC
jgi:hypothetical protein